MENLYSQYLKILRQPKIIFFPPPSAQSANNASFLFYEIDVYQQNLEVIPQLKFRHDIKIKGRDTNAKYSLHFIGDRCDRRVFQIEIYSFSYISHRSPNGSLWRGPHLYYDGCSRRTTAKIDTLDSEYWLKRFCRHTNLSIRETEGIFQRPLL
jgi:hypothetical protein